MCGCSMVAKLIFCTTLAEKCALVLSLDLPLQDYQIEVLEQLKGHQCGAINILLCMEKTVIAGLLVNSFAERTLRSLLSWHR